MFNIAKPSPQEFLEANPDLPSDVKELVRARPDLAHAVLFEGVPFQKGDALYTTKGNVVSITRSVPPSSAPASSETADAMLTRLAHKFHASEHAGLKQLCDSVGVARVARLLEVRENTSPIERAAPAPSPAPTSRAVPAAPSVDPSAEIANIGFQRAGLPVPVSRTEPPATAVHRHVEDHDASADLANFAMRRTEGDHIRSSIDALFPDPPNAA